MHILLVYSTKAYNFSRFLMSKKHDNDQIVITGRVHYSPIELLHYLIKKCTYKISHTNIIFLFYGYWKNSHRLTHYLLNFDVI